MSRSNPRRDRAEDRGRRPARTLSARIALRVSRYFEQPAFRISVVKRASIERRAIIQFTEDVSLPVVCPARRNLSCQFRKGTHRSVSHLDFDEISLKCSIRKNISPVLDSNTGSPSTARHLTTRFRSNTIKRIAKTFVQRCTSTALDNMIFV